MISGNKCQNCGKGIMYGHNVSHSKRRTRRIFKPNLHVVRVNVDGVMRRMKLCIKCSRLLKGKSTRDLKNKVKISKNSEVQSSQEAISVTT